MVKLVRKVKGSTLIEVLISMVILLICFSIGMASILQINRKQSTTVLTKATFVMQNYINSTIEERKFVDEEFENDGLTVRKTINSRLNHYPLVEIHFEIYSVATNQKLLETTKIVVDEE